MAAGGRGGSNSDCIVYIHARERERARSARQPVSPARAPPLRRSPPCRRGRAWRRRPRPSRTAPARRAAPARSATRAHHGTRARRRCPRAVARRDGQGAPPRIPPAPRAAAGASPRVRNGGEGSEARWDARVRRARTHQWHARAPAASAGARAPHVRRPADDHGHVELRCEAQQAAHACLNGGLVAQRRAACRARHAPPAAAVTRPNAPEARDRRLGVHFPRRAVRVAAAASVRVVLTTGVD